MRAREKTEEVLKDETHALAALLASPPSSCCCCSPTPPKALRSLLLLLPLLPFSPPSTMTATEASGGPVKTSPPARAPSADASSRSTPVTRAFEGGVGSSRGGAKREAAATRPRGEWQVARSSSSSFCQEERKLHRTARRLWSKLHGVLACFVWREERETGRGRGGGLVTYARS